MKKTKAFLKEMISIAGLSGYEAPIYDLIAKEWTPLTDKIQTDKVGSLQALKQGKGSKGQSLMIATHMDAIGLMVTKVEEDFLHFTQIGGIDPRVLPGTPVTIHGLDGNFPGMVILPPAHTIPKDIRDDAIPLSELRIDTGLRAATLAKKVQVGTLASFATPPTELDDNTLTGHSLDNRACVAVMTETLRHLQSRIHSWDVWAVATVQEETALLGAGTSAFQLRPTLAIVIDVTFGSGPGTSSHDSWKLGKGPTLDWGANTHPAFYEEFEKLAKELEIPYQNSHYTGGHSGTDAYPIQVSAHGIPTMVLSIPLRYMHTPVEMIQYKDLERLSRLLTEFILRLDDDFMEKLRWPEEVEDED